MTSLQFTPGKKAHLRKLLTNEYQRALIKLEGSLVGDDPNYFCQCFVDKVEKDSQGQYNNSQQSENMRISGVLKTYLGGRIKFGNTDDARIRMFGGVEGQNGGIPATLRNKF
jgi:hypothetical protein